MLQTSKQLTEVLLCSRCEQQLSVDENAMAQLVWRASGHLPILSKLGRPFLDKATGWRLAHLDSLDPATLVYFGASILWRAHHASKLENVLLDESLAEELRQFLQGQASAPNSIRFVVRIYQALSGKHSEAIGRSSMLPQTNERPGSGRLVWAILCGIQFEFWLGDQGSHWADPYCLLRRVPPLVVIEDPQASGLVESFREVRATATPKGKLAKRFTKTKGGD